MMEDTIDITVPINFGNNNIETFFVRVNGERETLDQSSILQIDSDEIINIIIRDSKKVFMKNKRFDTDDIIFILLDAFVDLNKKLDENDKVYIKSIYVRWRDKSTLYTINR